MNTVETVAVESSPQSEKYAELSHFYRHNFKKNVKMHMQIVVFIGAGAIGSCRSAF